MSGGHYSYNQSNIQLIAEELEQYIAEIENSEVDYYSIDTLNEMKIGLSVLKTAFVYAQRIDWLLSGDDSEESFHKRLKEDLEKM